MPSRYIALPVALVLSVVACRGISAAPQRPAKTPRLLALAHGNAYAISPADLPRDGSALGPEALHPLGFKVRGSAFVLLGGDAVLDSGMDGVWRTTVATGELTQLTSSPGWSLIDDASADGTVLLGSRFDHGVTIIHALRTQPISVDTELARFRNEFGKALSPDGKRALLAGASTECTASWLGACAVELWAIDLTTTPPSRRRLSSDGARAYHPIFVNGSGGDLIAYQTTEFDPSPACAVNINVCRHDLVLRKFLGDEAPVVLQKHALQAAYSADGTHFSFVTYDDPEAHCDVHTVGCMKDSLHVAEASKGLIGPPHRLVVAGVALMHQADVWSPDGAWLLYRAANFDRTYTVVRADGSDSRIIPDKAITVRGWLNGPW